MLAAARGPSQPQDPVSAAIEVRGELEQILSRGGSVECRFEWMELPEGVKPEWASAVDGGHRIVELEPASIYIVKSWSGSFGASSREVRLASVGIVVPPQLAEARVSIYREILEAAAALESVSMAEGGGIVLMDGSLTTAIRWWRPGFGRSGLGISEALDIAVSELHGDSELVEDLASPCSSPLGCIEKILYTARWRPFSARYAMRKASREGRAEGMEWIVALEVTEKLMLYKMLFEAAWSRGVTIVFIAKTARSNRMCRSMVKDMKIVASAKPVEPGVAVWSESYVEGAYRLTGLMDGHPGEEPGALYPRVAGLEEFYSKRLAAVEAYVRLAPAGPLLHVSIPLDAEKHNADSAIDELISAVSAVRGLPLSRGYPSLLALAHNMAKARESDANSALTALGLTSERRSRYVLGGGEG